jgi:hypothetical protein
MPFGIANSGCDAFPPASRSNTLFDGEADSRFAITHPDAPPPMTMSS